MDDKNKKLVISAAIIAAIIALGGIVYEQPIMTPDVYHIGDIVYTNDQAFIVQGIQGAQNDTYILVAIDPNSTNQMSNFGFSVNKQEMNFPIIGHIDKIPTISAVYGKDYPTYLGCRVCHRY